MSGKHDFRLDTGGETLQTLGYYQAGSKPTGRPPSTGEVAARHCDNTTDHPPVSACWPTSARRAADRT